MKIAVQGHCKCDPIIDASCRTAGQNIRKSSVEASTFR